MTWRTHKGGSCPVNPDSMVRPQIRVVSRSYAASRTPTPAKNWRWPWGRTEMPGDIIAYEQIGELAG